MIWGWCVGVYQYLRFLNTDLKYSLAEMHTYRQDCPYSSNAKREKCKERSCGVGDNRENFTKKSSTPFLY